MERPPRFDHVKHRSASGSALVSPLLSRSRFEGSSSASSSSSSSALPVVKKGVSAEDGSKKAFQRMKVVGSLEHIASEKWRACASTADLQATVSVPSPGLVTCSQWRMHDTKPYMLFSNSEGQENVCTVADFSTLEPCKTLPQETYACSADFNGSVVVLGNAQGSAHVARVDWSDLKAKFVWQKYSIVAGGSRGPKIDCIVCSKNERAFSAMETNSLHLWDYNCKDGPLHSVKIWSYDQRSVASCVDSESGTLCLVGSSKGELQLLDYRVIARTKSNASPWKMTSPHSGGFVTSLQWHPHVPYWFASAGDDGSIHVWDTRALSSSVCALKLAHGAGCAGLAWCPTHSELLASVGVDRELSVWNVRLSDEPSAASSVASFCQSRPLGVAWNDSTFCCSDNKGKITKGSLTKAFLSPMCPSSQTEEQEIQQLLYTRDLPEAFRQVVDKSQTLMKSGRHDEALELVQMCYPRSLAVKELATEADVAFREEIARVASYLPPSYPISSKAVASLRFIKMLRVSLYLEQLKSLKQWREMLNYTDEICKYIKKSAKRGPEFLLDAELLRDCVALVLDHHYLSGLSMGCSILRAVREDDFSRHASLTLLLLSPTVFDGFMGGMTQSSTDLDYVLNNQKVGLSQVDFVRDFHSRLWTESPFNRVDKMMRKTEQTLISVSCFVNRVYLMSLLQSGSFAKFFLAAGTIVNASPNCEFSSVIIPQQIIPKAISMAMEWAKLVLEELKSKFDPKKAHALVSLCTAIVVKASCGVPKKTVDRVTKVLQSLVKYVPGKHATALSAAVLEISPNPSEEQLKMFLSLLALKVN